MTERELIEGCIHRKRKCEKLLFERYAGQMMAACLRYAGNEAEAEDILQEGFIRVFRNLYQYRFDGSLEGWMRKVFVTVAIRHLSKKQLQFSGAESFPGNEPFVDPVVLSKFSEEELHTMIRAMPEGYRTVFNLYVMEGYNHEEIGQIMNIRPATSRGQLSNARKFLQALLLKKNHILKSIML